MEELLLDIAKTSPLIALLVYMMWWLRSRLEKRESEISELHEKLRESEKFALETFNKVSEVLKSMSTDQLLSNKDLTNELRSLREWIKENLNK